MKAICFFISISLMAACTSQTDNNRNNNTDTIKADSMPVLKPLVTDSASIVPPPTNDSNVVKPPQ
ncbi:MAG TPA: hypothetical protein PL045_00325 [Chitinophagaceae bacterium]|nr:hypothetical protein [Chitinophagaceae bacterium]